MSIDNLVIRECEPSDADQVARLSEQLGYPLTAEEVERRILSFQQRPDHAVLVACLPAKGVVGWIDIATAYRLHSGTYVEICGLVTDESVRSRGIGRALVAEAEAWAAKRAIAKIRVRSQLKRAGAHRFYLREHYTQVKTSVMFEKVL